MNNSGLDTIRFAQLLFGLEPDTPIAHEFDMGLGQPCDRWWSCQREHFAFWSIIQNTDGTKGYEHKPNTSAMKMYNMIGAPELLLWLIEALHISLKLDTTEFRKFVIELTKLGRKPKKQCKMIRDKYPYNVVEQWLVQK